MLDDGGVSWAAVILTGGRAARLGGIDKASLETADGLSLLDHALEAVAGAVEVVVVGPEQPTRRGVRFTREDPAGGGPLAGLAAGVAALASDPDHMIVLAVDMPHVTADTVARLLAAVQQGDGGIDAAWLTDGDGRRQLAGAVRPSLVPSSEEAYGAPMRLLMTAGAVRDVPAVDNEADDVDTWDDLARLRKPEPAARNTPDGLEGQAPFRKIGPVNLHDWIDELCDALDIETEVDEALILDLAKVAADNVVRPAAPVTTYLLGYAAGAAGADEDGIERLAARAQALAEGWDRPPDAVDPDDVEDVVPDDTGVDHSDDEYDE
jgi:molybdopterin-guanine dinucleotide biosynthesis protein A